MAPKEQKHLMAVAPDGGRRDRFVMTVSPAVAFRRIGYIAFQLG